MTHTLPLKGILFIVLSEFMFASMGVSIRLVSDNVDNEMIVFFRNLIGLLILLPWLMSSRSKGIKTNVLPLHMLRALAGLGAMYCFFYAIANMPLAMAMLLKLSSPLFIPLIALLWFGERLSARAFIALIVGFIGVGIILSPEVSEQNPVAYIALLGGVLAAVAKTTVSRLARTEPITRVVFYFMLVGTVVSAIPLAWSWSTPDSSTWLGLVGVGVLATTGQLLLTRGISLAPISRIGPFTYSSVLFAAAYGWFLWDEPITLTITLGAFLVVAAGLYASRERFQTVQRAQNRTQSSPAMEQEEVL
jgi:drug/metabolite transporter (DMT)-like permease